MKMFSSDISKKIFAFLDPGIRKRGTNKDLCHFLMKLTFFPNNFILVYGVLVPILVYGVPVLIQVVLSKFVSRLDRGEGG
jgi:hypothetical protein